MRKTTRLARQRRPRRMKKLNEIKRHERKVHTQKGL